MTRLVICEPFSGVDGTWVELPADLIRLGELILELEALAAAASAADPRTILIHDALAGLRRAYSTSVGALALEAARSAAKAKP